MCIRDISSFCVNLNNLIDSQGEVYAIDQHSEAPGPIASIPVDSDQTSMFYVWITDYLVNSAGYVLHSYGYLERNVTENDVRDLLMWCIK